ncbi:diguanylate cyclase [Neptuniibacter halophilus]|uniref:diguanylate cyclase n=1 Tax=Neptuniibacter halophilus TaxID=651666 RepID=UPI002572AE01|nr:diguanylate cyclase [Neptuniibacter halophilus]
MKLSNKLLVVQAIFIVLLMGGVAATVVTLGLPEVRKIERDNQIGDIHRVTNSLNNQLINLGLLAKDWGHWDDTFQYAQTPYPEYESSNLTPSTLEFNQTDLLLIVNQQNRVIWRMATEQMGDLNQLELTRSLQLPPDHILARPASEAKFEGIVHTRQGPLLLAGSPILTSNAEGPRRGTIFFGRLLSQAMTEKTAIQLEIPFSLSSSQAHLAEPQVRFISPTQIHTRDILPFANSDELTLQIDIRQERPFYQQALLAIRYSMLTVLVIGLLGCLITYLLLHHLLIDPIQRLQKQAEQFRNHNHRHQNFQILRRHDELGDLSASFANMATELSHHVHQLQKERNDLEVASNTDPLTGLHNRRYLEEYMSADRTWERNTTWSFFMLDLDLFKQINDQYGHDVGDVTLQQFAALLRKEFRETDILVRSGGEEFTIICQHTNLSTAENIAERLLKRVESFRFGPDNSIQVTCSIGFFSLPVADKAYGIQHWPKMLRVADIALYAAKYSGRNTWIGLEATTGCDAGQYPDQGQDIVHWLKENKLTLSSALSPGRIHWFRSPIGETSAH